MIVELARQDSRVGRLKFVPFHDDIEQMRLAVRGRYEAEHPGRTVR